MYLFMHLNELMMQARDESSSVPSGYIGLYRHMLARTVTAITLVALPAGAISTILTQSRQPFPFPLALAAIGMAGAIGATCVKRLWVISSVEVER